MSGLRLAWAFLYAGFYLQKNAMRDLAFPRTGDFSRRNAGQASTAAAGKLPRSLKPPGQALTTHEQRRFHHYFYGTTFLRALFCALRGYGPDARERCLFTNLAALAAFFDDLTDAFRHQDARRRDWQNDLLAYAQAADDERGLALHFLHNIQKDLWPENVARFRTFLHQVFTIEVSNGPSADPPDLKTLQKTTAEKGGYSVLLFRCLLRHPPAQAEQAALFEFGYLLQLTDDVFDVWFDRQAGVVTLATHFLERNEVAALEGIFEEQARRVQTALLNMKEDETRAYSENQVQIALGMVQFLIALGRVALSHYRSLQQKHGTLPLGDRAAMVVDMGRWVNRRRFLYRLLYLPKQ